MQDPTAISAANVLLVTTRAAGAARVSAMMGKRIANPAMRGQAATSTANVPLATTPMIGTMEISIMMDKQIVVDAIIPQMMKIIRSLCRNVQIVITRMIGMIK